MRSTPLAAAAFIAAIAMALGSGCGTPSAPQPGLLKTVVTPFHEVFRGHESTSEQLSIDIFEPIDVQVHNFAGDVVLRGRHGEGGTKGGSLSITRRAIHGFGRDDEAEASLADITIRHELREVLPGRFLLTIDCTTSHEEPWFQRVDIELEVSQLGAANITTTRGHVDIRESDHGCAVETTQGTCRFISRRAIVEPMTLVTSDSPIEVRLAPGSRGHIDAETVGGSVYSRVKIGRWLLRDSRNDGDSLHASLDEGANRIVLRTSDANIYFSVTETPDTVFSLIDEL